jgi:uncharacterized protein YjiS (DUF1127 family)
MRERRALNQNQSPATNGLARPAHRISERVMTANPSVVYQGPKPIPKSKPVPKPVPKPRSLWRRLRNGVANLIAALVQAHRMRQGIRALQGLDDRMLADIGVPRSGIEAAVRNGDRKARLAPGIEGRPSRPMAMAA